MKAKLFDKLAESIRKVSVIRRGARGVLRWFRRLWLPLFPIIIIASFLASSLVHVAPNEVLALDYGGWNYGYIGGPGWYLVDPWASRTTWTLAFDYPSVDQLLGAAIKADALADVAKEQEGTANVSDEDGLLALVELAQRYIDQRPEIAHPTIVKDVRFLLPDPSSSSRYDTEIAHYEYPTGYVVYNLNSVRETVRTDQDSLLGVTVHELAHSALGPFTGETLCQLLTIQVLYDMMQDHVPGAKYAFYSELAFWFYLSAYHRAQFYNGWRVLDLQSSWYVEEFLIRAEVAKYGWQTRTDEPVRVRNPFTSLKNAVLGKPFKYVDFAAAPPFRSLMEWAVNTVYYIQARGIRFVPGELAMKLGIAKYLYPLPEPFRLPPSFWHNEIVLKRGELDSVMTAREIITASNRVSHYREFQEKMKDSGNYFSRVWWAYMYGPLNMILNGYYMERPTVYTVMTFDPTTMRDTDWLMVQLFGFGLDVRMMRFEEIGPVVHKFLNLKPRPIVETGPDGLWRQYPYKRTIEDRFVAFPAVPLLYLVVVALVYLVVLAGRRLERLGMSVRLWRVIVIPQREGRDD